MSGPEEYGTARLVLDARAELGECPVWSARERVLWWVDIAGRAVHRFDPASGQNRSWAMPAEPGCLAVAASGGLVVALRDGVYRFFPEAGELRCLATAPYDTGTTRFNDGRCDARGRLWLGTIFEPRTAESASMYCLERGRLREAWGPRQGLGVKVSNGLAFDAGALYQSDTPNHVVYRFDYDPITGAATGRSEFARSAGDRGSSTYGGRPDGAAVDAQGCYWSAQYEGARILRYSRAGALVGIARVPARRPTMVAFGGPELRTLYVTTAREGASASELRSHPQSGGIFALEVRVAGLPEPCYEGE